MASTQARFIDVHGSLRLEVDGETAHVEADGPRLRVLLPDDNALAAVMRSLPPGASKRRRLAKASRLIARLGITAEVVVDGEPLLRAGYEVSPSFIAKLASLGPLHGTLATLVKLYRLQK